MGTGRATVTAVPPTISPAVPIIGNDPALLDTLRTVATRPAVTALVATDRHGHLPAARTQHLVTSADTQLRPPSPDTALDDVRPIADAMRHVAWRDTIAALHAARRDGDLIVGFAHIWTAVWHADVDLIALDEHHVVAGRARRGTVDHATDAAGADDLVDALVELAHRDSVDIVFTPSGLLQDQLAAPIVARRHPHGR